MPEGDERGSSADAHTYGTHHGSACVRQQAHLGVPLTFQLDSPGLCVIFAFYYTAPGIWYKHSPSTNTQEISQSLQDKEIARQRTGGRSA